MRANRTPRLRSIPKPANGSIQGNWHNQFREARSPKIRIRMGQAIMNTPPITQQEMSEKDVQHAKSLAVKLGYGDNTAYTSSSAMIGVFCLDSPGKNGGCIIKTDEFGFMFVQLEEDLQG